MLTTLRIRNLALVAEATLEFPRGLVVITGETGAGKSILLGALNLVLGERADRDLIRSGEDQCSVEAVFEVASLVARLGPLLEEHGIEPCAGGQLLLKRVFTQAGTNRQFINGTPTTLTVLAAVGEWLVDMHGPHDHQSLLQPGRQLAILDAFGRLQEKVAGFRARVAERNRFEAQRAELGMDERTYAQQVDLLRFQTQEIESARLAPEEESELELEHQRATHATRLLQLGQAALNLLAEDDTSVTTQAGAVGRLLQELHRIDPALEPLFGVHAQLLNSLQELQQQLTRYLDKVEADPARLEQLEERLNVLQSLKRKYGATVAQVIEFGTDARQRLEQLERREEEMRRLADQLVQADSALWGDGRALTAQRRAVIPRLVRAVSRELVDLGFRQSKFDVALRPLAPESSPADASAAPPSGGWRGTGLDEIEFLFAPNPGEPPRPLRSIASSGELARVMLGLKTVLAAEDEIPVLVFDEVEANVGGETAHAVGAKMRQIAAQHQVLCISHLPQVAAAGTAHYVVSKEVRGGRTLTSVQRLSGEERLTELARMLGGQTAAARRHAAELLGT